MTTYSAVSDLLLGDVQLGSLMDPQKFVNDACDEMNVRIGMVYSLPLPTLESHLTTLLKLINNRIASGRLIMAAAIGSEAANLHAYGESLVRDAYADLAKILDGTIPLDGATRRPNGNQALGPSVINGDTYSGVTAFERFAFPSDPIFAPSSVPIWRPADGSGPASSSGLDGGTP